jgi:RNA polymerase sigma factor (sigma-70 family)
MQEEKELVERLLAGDTDAEDRFYKMFRPRLYRASLYFLGAHDSEAEDIVQDTFMVALPKLKDYDFKAPIYAWLRQICLRLCYARMRKRSRVLMSMEEDMEMMMRRQALERVQSSDREAIQQEKLSLLHELKKQLSADSGQIIDMRHVQGLTYVQISRALAIPLGTVMSRLARARDQMRKLVEAAPESGLSIAA